MTSSTKMEVELIEKNGKTFLKIGEKEYDTSKDVDLHGCTSLTHLPDGLKAKRIIGYSE